MRAGVPFQMTVSEWVWVRLCVCVCVRMGVHATEWLWEFVCALRSFLLFDDVDTQTHVRTNTQSARSRGVMGKSPWPQFWEKSILLPPTAYPPPPLPSLTEPQTQSLSITGLTL